MERVEIPAVINIREAARRLSVTTETVRVLYQKGELEGFKKTTARNSPIMVTVESVAAFDQKRRHLRPAP